MKSRKYREYDSTKERFTLKNHYISKYFNLWCSKYHFKELSKEANQYLFRKLWKDGKIAAFKISKPEGVIDEAFTDTLVLAPFAPAHYNCYRFPVDVTLINTYNMPFIPSGLQKVFKDVVLLYLLPTKKGILELVEPLIDEIVNVRMTINSNLDSHKVPFVLGCSPEDEDNLYTLYSKVINGDKMLVGSFNEIEKLKPFQTGTPYIIDKLNDYINLLENQIKTILGVNNLGISEKKEHLVNGEIKVNDEEISTHDDLFRDSLNLWAEDVKTYLGITITLDDKEEETEESEEDKESEDEE